MITFKLRLIILGLILIVCLGDASLFAAEISLPLPRDAVKVSEKNNSMGPMQSIIEIYQSGLLPDKVESFYKKEMSRLGWTQEKNGFFTKDGYMVAITASVLVNEKTGSQFLISTTKTPDPKEILSQRKAKADKLSFMPVYPDCIQNFLWDISTGVSGSYETSDSIKDVIFFYKSSMLNYGWYLYSEIPIKEEVINYSGYDKSSNPVTTSNATLRFRKKSGESCVIMINSFSTLEYLLKGEKLAEGNTSLSAKTTILIVYNDQAKIK